ncbi:helix-turn-helix transcriptional regulator [Cohnella nanjingensis]|uniref:helix-turn-helix transcriptional regulator n=1 Tax=Cohnella nanjingensis TaxID=1387779 RepID=UPI0028AFC158|nr:helix-turn-helix transcriptional regulator [Cohnella nanjingensis]
MELTSRQAEIIELVRKHAPITGERIAELLGVTRPTIRSDLGLLVMLGYIDAKPKVGYFAGSESREAKSEIAPRAETRVREVMGVPIVLLETATVSDAIVMLFLENVGNLIIVDASGSLAGIVSRKDLLKVTFNNPQASTVPLNMVMTRAPNVITIAPDETVREAMGRMIQHEVDGLPVVERSGPEAAPRTEVIGRITKTTVIKLLYEAIRLT